MYVCVCNFSHEFILINLKKKKFSFLLSPLRVYFVDKGKNEKMMIIIKHTHKHLFEGEEGGGREKCIKSKEKHIGKKYLNVNK